MKAKLVGYKAVDFKDPKTNDTIQGISLFVTYRDPDVNGESVKKFFVRAEHAEMICVSLPDSVGKYVDFDMGMSGKLMGVTVWPEKEGK